MQSNISRFLVAIGSVLAIVVLFLVFSDNEDSESEGTADSDSPSVVSTGPVDDDGSTKPRATGQGGTPAEKPSEGEIPLLVIRGGEPEGGVRELEFDKSEEIRFAIKSDVDDEVHVHGYDVSREIQAGKTTELAFEATIDGVYEVELENSAVPIAELSISP